jgi:hypothetical protein
MSRSILLFFIAVFLTTTSYSQVELINGVHPKKLTHEDMVRIYGDIFKPGKVFKTAGDPREIKEVIISGNKIITVIYNYGSITKPATLINIADLVWQGLGYGYEFGPLAAAQVITELQGGGIDTIEIVSDSYVNPNQGTYSPDGSLKWGWLPKPGYADPNQNAIATLNANDNNGDGKPDSWPERWFSPGAGTYLWPAFLGDQATAPDEEAYFVMDDFTNAEWPYYPFPSDSSKRGLGFDSEVRILQYNNPLAEDIMFLIYRKTNASEKDLPLVYFGMQGDPHVGGAGDFNDDRAFFIPPAGPLADPYPQRARSMVYAWDDDGVGDGGRRTGYFGWQFLESPTNSVDGIDNDDDGIIDESPFNSSGIFIDGITVPLTQGINDVAKYTEVYGEPKPRWSGDEDGDWNPEFDDVGIDGIGPDSPNYPGPDFGEGDGRPSQGWYLDLDGNEAYDIGEPISEDRLPGYLWAGSEPNFGLRDISESDQLGLTSFHAAQWGGSNFPINTSLMWEWLSSGTIDPNQELLNSPGDNIFNFGTGPLSLKAKETQRFSMSILFGDNLDDLVLNAETSTRILESDYRFAKPPEKPVVQAVAGDGKVTLYWDAKSEESFDPFTRSNDFQGYKIYRSRDFRFADVYTITDGNGVPFLGQALFDPNTGRRAQFDLVDSLQGFHPVEYLGRAVKYYLGNNSGLVHEYVDSTVINGINYFYAVVAYDAGSIQFGIPPSETQAVIQQDPITSELIFDVNTVQVTPNPLGSGIKGAEVGIGGLPTQVSGNATGDIRIEVKDDLLVGDKTYRLFFTSDETYNIVDSAGVEETFISRDTIFVNLRNQNIQEESFQVFDAGNNLVDPSRYFLNPEAGRIRGLGNGLPGGEMFKAVYKYFPVYNSRLLQNEDGNDSFDGLRVYVRNDSLTINYQESGFIVNNSQTNLRDTIIQPATVGNPRVKYRADWEIRWHGFDTTATGEWLNPGDTVPTNLGTVRIVTPFTIWNISENVPAEYLIFVPTGTPNLSKWRISRDASRNHRIILRPQNPTGSITSYELIFSFPADTNITPVLPQNGDVYLVKTRKPFQAGDTYVFSSKSSEFVSENASANMNEIYVVPNPYVAYSRAENPGLFPDSRGDRVLQFRNLPPKCTIRIYTLLGELIQTIEKDDNSSLASWDMLSYESQRIAYGVYIYHIDAGDVGEKIGRFAVIK